MKNRVFFHIIAILIFFSSLNSAVANTTLRVPHHSDPRPNTKKYICLELPIELLFDERILILPWDAVYYFNNYLQYTMMYIALEKDITKIRAKLKAHNLLDADTIIARKKYMMQYLQKSGLLDRIATYRGYPELNECRTHIKKTSDRLKAVIQDELARNNGEGISQS